MRGLGARPHTKRTPEGIFPWILVGTAVLVLSIMLLLPLTLIFVEAFRQGVQTYTKALIDPDAASAIRLTVFCCFIAVPINLIFGVAAAWVISKFNFRGKTLLISLVDIPFAVSPVVAGLMLILLFGNHGWWGPWLARNDLQIIFAVPGIILATIFITLPFIARELIPLMASQGSDEETAAVSLGANGRQTFWLVTLPNIKWGLLYGVILCTARAVGEFGAVSVVSGHIRGETNTVPLHIEVLYNEYQFSAAFAVASLLAFMAIVTLIAKAIVERRVLANTPVSEG